MSTRLTYIVVFLIYLAGFSVFDIYDYSQNKKELYASLDQRLELVARDANSILCNSEYHSNQTQTTIDEPTYLAHSKLLTQIAINHKVDYVYSMMLKDGKAYFTSTNYKNGEWNDAYKKDFFQPYPQASQALLASFETQKIGYEESSDKWGEFRSIFIPYIAKNGTHYLVGADIKTDYINQKLRDIFIKNLIIGFYFMVILIPVYYILSHHNRAQKQILEDRIQRRTKQIELMSAQQGIHIEKLTRIATAISNEHDMPTLLELILDGAKELTNSDGGTLYLKSKDGKSLQFHVVKTNSLGIAMGGTKGAITWPQLPLYLEDGSPNRSMVAALCAVTGEVINIPDVYEAEGFNFEGTKRFDATNNFRSKSMLVIPLKNHENEIVGVVQLINKLDSEASIQAYDEHDTTTSLSLASQAAMAITNSLLIQGLEDLLMAFIESIARAIDEKSAYTGGHVRRVAEIARDFAQKISQDDVNFPTIHYTDEELKQIYIAGLMHDIGKITTPVHIVDKSTKLEAIFDRVAYVVLKCELLKHQKPELSEELDSDIEFIKTANKGGEFMSDEAIERVKKIASYQIMIGGVEQNLLTEDEVYNLSIRRGTLTKEDRDIINAHARISVEMLEKLPFPKKLSRVPEIAGNHHEQPSGKGYPRGLKGDELSLESRIMAIADIFEALSSSDRPYKDGKKLSECFKILGFMAKDNEVDPVLTKYYYDSNLYIDYAKANLKDYQIDEVKEFKV